MEDGVILMARAGGRPRTKGSLKVYCTRNNTHTVHLEEEVVESKKWRTVVARALREAQTETHGKLLQYPDAVEVRLVFFFPRQEAVAGGPVPSHSTEWPTHITLGDADKLTRNILDAMLTPEKRAQFPLCSALLKDDSQVVKLQVAKFWVRAGVEPGVQILVLKTRSVEEELEEAARWMKLA